MMILIRDQLMVRFWLRFRANDVPYYTIEGKQYPAELVRINYRQITYGKVEAFLIEYGKIYRKIGNTKAYLITALYNIPLTADAALSNRVKSDMYGGR